MASQKADPDLEDRMRSMILGNASVSGPSPAPAAGEDQDEGQGTPKASRKRMNQAQRRQMSAQLTIPIDPRVTVDAGGLRNNQSAGFGNQQHHHYYRQHEQHHQPHHYQYQHQHQRGGWQQRGAQRPQSAGYQQASFGSYGPQRSAGFNAPSPYGQPSPYNGPSPGFPTHGGNSHSNWRSAQQGHNFDLASPRGPRQLYNPKQSPHPENTEAQAALLNQLSNDIIVNVEIEAAEIQEKEAFRVKIEEICRKVITAFEVDNNGIVDFPSDSVQMRCFGSLASGFATKAADMDLGLLSPLSRIQPDSQESAIPRLLEKALLDAGLGARLLTRTRVPIIKLCEKPSEKLRQDLLDARDRWEKGLDAEQEPHNTGTQQDADDDAQEDKDQDPLVLRGGGPTSKVDVPANKTAAETREQMIANLKQPQGQTLTNYEAATKKLLRTIGARDITLSTAQDFTLDDYQILTDVCLAFVRGLKDHDLRDRLLAYASFSSAVESPMPKWRSLSGVFTQVEGESLVRMWETRKLVGTEYQEYQAASKVKTWQDLQNKQSYGLDAIGYNKELLNALVLLKTIPTLQIMSLSQTPVESAKAYHLRTENALRDIGGFDRIMPDNTILPIVVEQYIQGIRNQDWRDQVKKEAAAMSAEVNLRSVARRHKALQLASEYEKAVSKNLFPKDHVEDIQAYIVILRSPLVRTMVSGQVQFMIPIPADQSRLLAIMKSLTDPAKLAPNQPRDPYRDSLEFPKDGVGVQCDINFSAHLALQNTRLLRCYAATDPRVRPMVLFIKHWAKARGINTAYRGTLSSYGYVLMVLHYLVNVAQPFVCPNLQHLAPPPHPNMSTEEYKETVECKGHNVQFWRDEAEITRLSREGALNQNHESLGMLLRGFFEYYAYNGFIQGIKGRGFDWGRDVLSLRFRGGLLAKQDKGWTGAKTTVVQVAGRGPSAAELTSPVNAAVASPGFGPSLNGTNDQSQASSGVPILTQQQKPVETKEIRHRYLFAIEDPFEHDHNVARTVTHNGIVAIRDEFRRAWRIIKATGMPSSKGPVEDLLADAGEEAAKTEKTPFWELLTEIHGVEDAEM